jgi:hypothetical protein
MRTYSENESLLDEQDQLTNGKASKEDNAPPIARRLPMVATASSRRISPISHLVCQQGHE